MYARINPVEELGAAGPTGTLLTDALGSVLALADEAGQLKTTYQYEPYGATTAQGEASGNPFQYTSRENDGTGLYYYRAQYYPPGLERFVAEDPIGLAGGINAYRYVYADNQPTMQIDPLGLCPMCIVPTIPYIPEAIIIASTWWASQQVVNQVKTPTTGPADSWYTNPESGQERKYGPKGNPKWALIGIQTM